MLILTELMLLVLMSIICCEALSPASDTMVRIMPSSACHNDLLPGRVVLSPLVKLIVTTSRLFL